MRHRTPHASARPSRRNRPLRSRYATPLLSSLRSIAMIDAIERGQVLNLPIHSERITFGLGWTSPASAGPSDYDLAAVLMSESGDVVDVVYHRCLSACGMCVRHLGDERGAKCHPAEDNEQIAVYPSMVPAIVKAIFFVASATPRSSEDAPGFLRLDKLHFSVASFDPARCGPGFVIVPINRSLLTLRPAACPTLVMA